MNNFQILNNKITFYLSANYTTGFSWSFIIEDENIIKNTKEDYIPLNSLCGADGKYIAEFSSLSDGKTLITFNYKRQWEKMTINKLSYLIIVQNNQIIDCILL